MLRVFAPLVRARVRAFAPAALPVGWVEYKDKDGEKYFHNRSSGTTQWERPPPPPAEKFPRRDELPRRDEFQRRDEFPRRDLAPLRSDRPGVTRRAWFDEELPKADWSDTQPVVRADYVLHARVAARSREENAAWLKERNVTASDAIAPVTSFEEAFEPAGEAGARILRGLRAKFGEDGAPSTIQALAWPVASAGRDLVGIAETGCGKTLAYSLPSLLQPQQSGGPRTLVLAPTRELACQIVEEAGAFTSSICAVYGGVRKDQQVRALRQGRDVVVATPGRLLDLLNQRECSLQHVTTLVLDEADRMLDMGFEPQIRQVVSQIRPDRQTLFFSATWPADIRKLARDLARSDPVHVQVGNTELQVNPKIEQRVEVVEEEDKCKALQDLLAENPGERMLVFTETKRKADALCRELRATRLNCAAIHGDKTQDQRDYALDSFRRDKTRVLIATDVAQRGLDIKDVNFVVNFDRPKTIEDYTHRIGRTGRAGKAGTAISFLTPQRSTENRRMSREIANAMRSVKQKPSKQLLQLH